MTLSGTVSDVVVLPRFKLDLSSVCTTFWTMYCCTAPAGSESLIKRYFGAILKFLSTNQLEEGFPYKNNVV